MDAEALSARFRTEIERTQQKISRYEDMTKPVAPDNAIGRVSRMDAINNKGVMDAALRKARERLAGLERHFKNLHSPDFANCNKCGKNIPIDRIFMAPESSFCVTCAR